MKRALLMIALLGGCDQTPPEVKAAMTADARYVFVTQNGDRDGRCEAAREAKDAWSRTTDSERYLHAQLRYNHVCRDL